MTKIKSAKEWTQVWVKVGHNDTRIAALIREAQAEAWEAGREAAVGIIVTRKWGNGPKLKDKRSWNPTPRQRAYADAIRALSNPFKESEPVPPHPIECDDEGRAKVRGGGK